MLLHYMFASTSSVRWSVASSSGRSTRPFSCAAAATCSGTGRWWSCKRPVGRPCWTSCRWWGWRATKGSRARWWRRRRTAWRTRRTARTRPTWRSWWRTASTARRRRRRWCRAPSTLSSRWSSCVSRTSGSSSAAAGRAMACLGSACASAYYRSSSPVSRAPPSCAVRTNAVARTTPIATVSTNGCSAGWNPLLTSLRWSLPLHSGLFSLPTLVCVCATSVWDWI